MPWPWGAGTAKQALKRSNRHMRRVHAKQGHEGTLLFETFEERVLLSATPFSAPQPVLHEADGAQLLVSLSGPGQVQAVQGAAGAELIVTGTNATSNLTLTVKGGSGHFLLNDIDVTGSLGYLNGAGVNLQGALTLGGAAQSINLGDLSNSTVTTAGSVSSMNFGNIQNSSVSVSGSIGSFVDNSWIATGGSNHLNATSISVLDSRGNFDASVALSGSPGSTGPTLGAAEIGGTLADGYWDVVGNTGIVSAGQVASNWIGNFTNSVTFTTVPAGQSNGDFDGTLATVDLKGFVVLGNLDDARLEIGANLGSTGTLGHNASQYSTGRLDSLLVRGSFINSYIWVGVDPGPNGYDKGGDTFVGNSANDRVGSIVINGTLDATSKVEAGVFALPPIADFKLVTPNVDPHFITHTVGLAPASPTLALTLSNTGSVSGLTDSPTVTASFTDARAVTSLVATLDGRGANAVNLLTNPQANGTVAITPNLFQILAGGTLKDGAHSLTVAATDAAGNVTTQTLTFTLDTKSPALTAALANPTGGAGSTITANDTIGGTAADPGDGLASLRIGFDQTAASQFTDVTAAVGSNGSFTLTPAQLQQAFGGVVPDGMHTLHLIATDKAGNATSANVTFDLDTKAPTVTLALADDTGAPGTTNLTSNPATAATFSAESNIVSLSGTLDGLSSHSIGNLLTQAEASGTLTISTATLQSLAGGALKDGSHTLTVVATDQAGNHATQTLTFTLDTTAPTVTAALANDTGVSATDRITSDDTVSGKIGDATDGIVSFKAGLDGTTAANGMSVLSALNANGSFTLTPALLQQVFGGKLADGAHTLHLLATDAAGNTSTFDLSFVLDTTAPTVTAGLAHNTGVNQLTGAPISGLADDSTIAGTVADATDQVIALRVAVDGGGTVDVSQKLNANGTFILDPALLASVAGGKLVDGQHTVHVTAFDQAGESSETDVTFTLKTSAPATPTFTLAPADTSSTLGANQTTAATATLVGQTDPGIAVTLTLANGSTLSTVSNTQGHFQFSNVALASGANVLTAQATDNAGNTSNFTVTLQRNAPTSAQPDSVLQWDAITLQAIQSAADDPVVASRVLALESLAVYDTINSINGTQSYFVHLGAPADTSTDAAVAAAAHEVLSKLYPQEQSALDALFAQSLAAIPNGQGKIDGVALGTQIADDILGLRANDGSQITAVDPGSDVAGQWRPTGPDFGLAISPQFANVNPFALNSADQFLSSIAPPPALDSAAYAAAVQQVDALGSLTSTQRTADQTQIAEFWAGGLGSVTIGGQWNQIAAQVAQNAGDSEGEDARLFAELNVGLADTGIATWNAKYNFNLWSPVTAIRNADSSVNSALTADPNFAPLVTTPQAPEYVETQASFSAAAADILTSFFGNNVSFTAASTAANGGTRSFTSFSQAAQEAGSSGLFAGTDFQFSNLAGQALGKSVGDFVLQAFNTAKPFDPPRIALNTPSGAAPISTTTNIVTNADPVISGTVLDNLSGVQTLTAQIDNGATTSVTFDKNGNFTLPLNFALDGSADGQHTVTLIATNAAGAASTSVVTVTLATKAPNLAGLQIPGQNGALVPGSGLMGTVATETGTNLAGLTYSFDNGTNNPVAFDTSGNVNQAFDLSKLTLGAHTLTITATDTAGNVTTATLSVNLAQLVPLTVTSIDPADDSAGIGVTFQPLITFSRPVNLSTLNNGDFFVTDSAGNVLPTKIVPWADGMHAWIMPAGGDDSAWPGASTLTIHVVGSEIKGLDGSPLDADGTGDPAGSTLTQSFSTVNTAPVAGTSISGTVIDPGPSFTVGSQDNFTIGPNGQQVPKYPIAGVEVYVLGDEKDAVFTDANGNFTLKNVPAGDVKLVIDGRAATNDPAGVKYPNLTIDLNVQPGVNNIVGGTPGSVGSLAANVNGSDIVLPRVEASTFATLSTTAPTVLTASADTSPDNLTAAQREQFSVTVQPGSLLDANGNPMDANTPIGVSIIPKATIQNLLPPGTFQTSLVFTVQVPQDTFFTAPASVTMPNAFNAPPGTKLNLLTFDYTTGQVSVAGTCTVSADGKTVTTDPGVGITKSGWFTITPEGSQLFSNPFAACKSSLLDILGNVNPYTYLKDAAKCLSSFIPGLSGLDELYSSFKNLQAGIDSVVGGMTSVGQDFANCNPMAGAQLFQNILSGSAQTALGLFQLGSAVLEEAVPPVGIAVTCAKATLNVVDKIGQEAIKDGCAKDNPLLLNAVKDINLADNFINGKSAIEAAFDMKEIQDDYEKSIAAAESVIAANPNPACDSPQEDAVVQTLQQQVQNLQELESQISSYVQASSSDFNSVNTAIQNNTFNPNNLINDINTIIQSGVGTAPNAPYLITLANGTAIHGAAKGDGSIGAFLPANTKFTISVYDPRLQLVGTASGTTNASGINTEMPQLQWQSFSELPLDSGGVPVIVDQILGLNPGSPQQLVPGMSNLQAIQDGLNQTSSLASTTGVIGSVAMQGSAQAVTVVQENTNAGSTAQTAYVAAGSGGLAIIDASNPVSPVLLSETALGGNATGVDVSGNFAAVATGNTLQILDVSEPTSPTVLHSIAVNATRVQIFNGTAFVNDGGKIDAYDLATGQLEQSLAVTNIGPNALPTNIVGLTRDGSNLYAVDDQSTVYSLSIGANNALSALGFVPTQVQNGANGLRLTVSNGVLYVGNATAALGPGIAASYQTIDVSNPSAMRVLTSESGLGTSIVSTGIAVNGSGLGVTVGVDPTGANILDVVDTTNPSNNDAFVTRFGLPGQPFDVAFGNGFALVADGSGGLQIVATRAFDTQGSAPSLTITSGPGAGIDPATLGNTTFNFTEGQSVSFGVTVQDKLPVVKTELLINGAVVASNNNGPTFNLSAVIPSLDTLGDEAQRTSNPANQVVLQLRATDAAGRTTLSGPITGIVAADTTAPVLVSQNIAEGATVSSTFPQFIFNFSKPLDPTTVADQTFSVIGSKGNAVASTSLQLINGGQSVLATFASLPVGNYKFQIDAANVTDRAGNALGTTPLVTDFSTTSGFTDTWVGPSGGDWNAAANWSAGRVPAASDNVLVQLAPGATININSGAQSVASLTETGGGTFNVNGGSLNVVGALTMADNLTLVGGTAIVSVSGPVKIGGALTVNAGAFVAKGSAAINTLAQNAGLISLDLGASVNNFTQNFGTLSTPQQVVVSQSAAFTGGELLGPGSLVVQGQIQLLAVKLGGGFTLFNAATGTVTALAGSAEITTVSGGTSATDGTFVNTGNLVVNTKGGFRTFVPFSNSGTITVGNNNTLQTEEDFNSSGTVQLGTNSILTVSGNSNVSGIINGATGSLVRFGDQVTEPLTFELTDTGQINGANVKIAVFNSTIAGTIVLPPAGFVDLLTGGTTITGSVSGDNSTGINVQGNASLSGGHSASLSVGSFGAGGGGVDFAGNAIINALNILNSNLVNLGSNVTFNTLLISGGTLTIDSPQTLSSLAMTGGTLAGAGTLTVTGTTTISGGVMSGTGKVIAQGTLNISNGFTLGVGRVLENQGVATSSSSSAIGGTIINDAGAIFTSNGDTFTGQSGVPGTFVNNGTFVKTGANSNLQIGFSNTGTLQVNSGQLLLAQSLENAGTVDLGAGATLNVNGSFIMDSSAVLEIGLSSSGVGLLNLTKSGATATLGGTLITLPAPGFAPTIGSSFTFATFPSSIGAFGTIQEGALATGEALNFDNKTTGQLKLDVVP